MKKFIILLIMCFPLCLWAFDFGVELDQDFGFGGIGSESETDYSAALIPYFAAPLGNSGDLYISAALEGVYGEYEKFTFLAELLHAEISLRFGGFKIRAGRIPYADPLGFTVEGFFDGAQFLFDTKIGTFNAGGWYTGLLYKKSANITMTPYDIISYYTDLDYDDFSGTYFASKRILMALGWENPSIAELIRVRTAVFGQLDLNDTDNPYNSIYISLKTLIPVKRFVISAGGCMQILPGKGFAAELGGSWMMPSSFYSQLSLIGRYSSGETDMIDPFIPITTIPQGSVLEAKFSGISAFFLDYTAQLHPAVTTALTASYFIRNDEVSYAGYPVSGADSGGYALGGEFFGRLAWSPVTDISLNLGAGVFTPAIGNVNPKADAQWRVELGLIIILY